MSEPEPADIVAVDATPERPRRRRTGAVAVVLVALVAVGAGVTWVATHGSGEGSAGASICPSSTPTTTYDPDDPGGRRPADLVPATPTVPGLDDRLVPTADPSEIVVCEYHVPYETFDRYPVPASADSNLPFGSDVPATPEPVPTGLAAGDDLPLGRTAAHGPADPSVGPLLAALHAATVQTDGYYSCTFVDFGTPAPQYLLRLTYDDGVVWVAGPASCTSTNGVASSVTDLSEAVFWALDHATATTTDVRTGRASTTPTPTPTPTVGVTTPPVDPAEPPMPTLPAGSPDPTASGSEPGSEPESSDPCVPTGSPLPGGPDRFVPFAPTSVLVCHAGPDSPDAWTTHREQPADTAQTVLDALTTLPAVPSDAALACEVTPRDRWTLVFRGADGAIEVVLVDTGDCSWASNGWRTAQTDAGFLALLGELD